MLVGIAFSQSFHTTVLLTFQFRNYLLEKIERKNLEGSGFVLIPKMRKNNKEPRIVTWASRPEPK